MEAIILAGGFGTRIKKIINNLPKAMAPISGRPFLEYILENLSEKGFKRVILSLGYKHEIISKHFGKQYKNIQIYYEIEESPLGTGGAIRAALKNCVEKNVYIFNGDTYLNLEIMEIEKIIKKENTPIIVVRKVKNTERFGKIIIKEERIIEFLEKKTKGPGYINAGCYILPINIFKDYPISGPFSIEKDYFCDAVKRKKFKAFITRCEFIDIGIPNDYYKAIKMIEKK